MVTRDVAPQTFVVNISQTNESFVLRDEPLQISLETGHKLVSVSYSVLSALNVAPGTFMFVHVGTVKHTGDVVVGLSEANSSIVACRGNCVSIDVSPNQVQKLVSGISWELLARCLVEQVHANSYLLVHEPDQYFASALVRRAAAKGIRIIFSTTATEIEDPAWIVFHPLVSERVIKKKLPKGLTHFFSLAVKETTKDVGPRILMGLSTACQRIDASALFRDRSLMGSSDEETVANMLNDAVSQAKTNVFQNTPSLVPPSHITNTAISKLPTTIIDWTADDVVATQVQPPNSDCLFSEDKTYLLVGLTGQIGQSLCEWMARNGAGCICLTSRNPNINDEWLESFKNTGTTVKVFAMYVNLYNN